MYQTMDLGRCSDLADGAFIEAFESLALSPERFRHADHVRLGFLYLRELGLHETLRRYPDGLRRFAAHHGAADRYHETVTWGLVVLIHERLAARETPPGWATFAEENPDLLRWKDGAFFDYYRADILESDLARRTFVLPR